MDGGPRRDGELRRHGGLRKDGGLRRGGGFSKWKMDFVPALWTSKRCGSSEVRWSGGEQKCWYGTREVSANVCEVKLFPSFFYFTKCPLVDGNT